ncbi:hypothetical protein Hanom_Chr06g00489361 [Helianthus anomalus]
MHLRVMASREKVKDVGPVKEKYQENTLYKSLTAHSSECTVIPKGALVLVAISLCWPNFQIYPAFNTIDGGKFLKRC